MPAWRMFIASSQKGIEYAKAIKAVINEKLERDACTVWNEGDFKHGKSFLETLEKVRSKYSCGLAVFTADHKVGDQWAPTDSVVLENGLFLGAFGRKRTFVLREDRLPKDRKDLKIPSDLLGITLGRFTRVNGKNPDYRKAVKKASLEVLKLLEKRPPLRAK